MYGYSVTAVRVVRKGYEDAPLQVDNMDGQGADLAESWRTYFLTIRKDHQVRRRRYWQSRPISSPTTQLDATWMSLDIEYGTNGVPGRLFDTSNDHPRATVRPQDAAVYEHRHILARPTGGSAVLLAGEVIGLARAQAGPLDHFRKEFERANHELQLKFDYVTDGSYWESFIDSAEMKSATVTRQAPIAPYFRSSTSGAVPFAELKTTVKPVGRTRFGGSAVFRPILNGQVSPREAFGLDYDPDRTALTLVSRGQQRTVYLSAEEPPSFVYPVGDADRRDRPPGSEFTAAATDTLKRLLPLYS